MSTPTRRGRSVPTTRSNKPSMTIFYAVIGVVAIVGVVILGTIFASGQGTTASSPATGSVAQQSDDVDAPVGTTEDGFYYKGDPEAPVTVIEYSDFQCPACGRFATSPIYTQLNQDYIATGQVHFVFHEFPLPQHGNSPKASEAARCAGDQGQFWMMHNLIFQRQQQWSILPSPDNMFARMAGELGLDGEQFEQCLSSGVHAQDVITARSSAQSAQIPATPTFVVNGIQANSNQLITVIEAALANAQE